VDHRGIFWSIDSFQLKKRGSVTAADGFHMQAGCFDNIMKKHMLKAMGKAIADGFAPDDMLIDKFNGDDRVCATDIITTRHWCQRECRCGFLS
jgi:hypothetical protein